MNDNEKPKTHEESPEQEKADWEDARLAWSEEQEKRPSDSCQNAERIHGGAGQPKQPETSTPLDDAAC